MGAGRRTETVNYNGHPFGAGANTIKTAPQRKLAERNRLGSVIFGCTNATYFECVNNKLFGLPFSHHTYVEHIEVGMPLFLFNYTERKMHGIFEAASDGALNINPSAWTAGDGRTQYPSQVKVKLRQDFSRIVSLPESVFKETLIESYHSPNHFFFEVDMEQTDRLIKLFERGAGSAYRPIGAVAPVGPVPPKSSTNAWQTMSPSKVWKKANGSTEMDDKLKLKKPATVVMSEWEKGAQYFPSSSKDVVPDEEVTSNQHSFWGRKATSGDESLSDGSEELNTYKVPEVASEADMRRVMSNEKPDQDHGVQVKSASGYRPNLSGTAEAHTSVAEEWYSNDPNTKRENIVPANKEEEMRRVFERLKVIKNVAKETQMPEAQLVVQAQRDGELVVRNTNHGTAEWERLARDRSVQEQGILREEREKLGVTLSDLDSSVSMTVKKNLELYAMAIAQMRQDGIELRRLLDEARMRPEELERLSLIENSNVAMAAEIQTLKLEILDLRRQLGKSVGQERVERLYENGVSQLTTVVEPYDNKMPPDIYLIGGLGDQLSGLESVMVWSPGTDRLSTAAPMLTPRCCAGASVLDGYIYVFGGGDGSSWYDTVERYDRREDKWVSCAPMKTKRGSLGGVTVGDRIFAVGGGNGQVSFSEVESYDPCLGAWLPSTSMFQKRFCVAATELGGALYAFGGFDGEQYLMSVERFDPREALWMRMPSMSVKRGSLSAAALNGRIYALGGYDGDGILDVVETFDPRAGRWDMSHPMCCQRAYGAVSVVGDALYYMGGLAEDEAVDSIQRFTEATGWQSMRPRVIGKRSCLAAVVL